MDTLEVKDAPSWTKFVTDFDATKRLFDDNFAGLLASGNFIRSKHPEELPVYNKMVAEGQKHQRTLNTLANIKSTVSGWLGTIGGFFSRNNYFGDLGLVPVIWGIAAATTALAAIGYWVKDAFQFSRRLNELQRLEAQGISPGEASRIVNRTLGTTGARLFGIDIRWLIAGGALLFFGPALMRLLKARQ